MPSVFVRIKEGKIINTKAIATAFKTLKDGTYLVDINNAKKRSTVQNAFYWLLLTEYIQPALYDAGWNIKTKEQAHEFCKNLFLKGTEVNEKTGEEVPIVKSTTDLTTVEWEQYREELNQWASEYLGVVLPDPGQQMAML